MSEKVKSLFEITKLDKLFPIFLTQQEAVAKVK
jgi:anti-anti-sigma regulatory factor